MNHFEVCLPSSQAFPKRPWAELIRYQREISARDCLMSKAFVLLFSMRKYKFDIKENLSYSVRQMMP